MSESWTISLLRLKTPSKALKGISRHNGYTQLPASPTLVRNMFGKESKTYKEYMQKRNKLLSKKKETTSFDKRLRDYQNQDVAFLSSIKNKGIFNQQRTGKTPTTLVSMKHRNEKDCLFLVPNSTLYQWQDEHHKWLNPNVQLITSQTPKTKRKEQILNREKDIITSYNLVHNDNETWMKRPPKVMIIDEAHRLRNYKGLYSRQSPKTFKSIARLAKQTEGRYALTGTPTPNDPENIFGILSFLFPTLFTSFWNFAEYYFIMEDTIINGNMDTVKTVKGFKSKDKKRELQEFLELISTQRKRKDIMKWLKEIQHENIIIPASKEQLRLEEQLREYFEIGDIEAVNILDQMMKNRQLSLAPKLLGINKKSAKTEWLKDYRKDYPEHSIIIASVFTSYLKMLKKEVFPEAKMLIGDTPDPKRYEIETAFNKKEVKMILANIEVAHVGMKLYGADTLIFTDPSLTYTNNEQMMDRLLAITEIIAKNQEPQNTYILWTDMKIDKYLQKMFKKKASKTKIINDYARALKGARGALKGGEPNAR